MINYHFRGLRYRQNLWKPFIQELHFWLATWRPQSKQLLLIGPSAGYSLPTSWLKQFEQIDVIDPDPLAPWLFQWNHFRPSTWSSQDYFAPESGQFHWNRTEELIQQYPRHALLFCNFLGQIPITYPHAFENDNPSWQNWKAQLAKELRHREFASYHDYYSMPYNFEFKNKGKTNSSKPEFQIHSPQKQLEITDHLISDLFSQVPIRKYLKWQLTPNYFHLIELVKNS